MSRDNIVYTICGLLLGLVIGSFVIGPKLAQSKLAGAQPAASAPAAAPMADTSAAQPAAAGAAAMGPIFQQINELKATLERDPNNLEALTQLGGMYMEAGKFPQAIEYFERALKIRDDPQMRTDLGVCYRNVNERDKALAEFQHVAQADPTQWQALFNEVILLGEAHRLDEAKSELAKLQKLRPDDPDVQRLAQSIAQLR